MHPPPRDLPDDLRLPLRSGAEWWYWTGGRPALDLVNTLRERWRRRVECLCDPRDLGLWLQRAGLAPAGLRPTREHLAAARALREAVDACVVARVEGRPAPPEAVAGVAAHLAPAPAPTLTADGGVPVLHTAAGGDPVRAALAALALDAATMLGTPERERIRICGSPTCSARFYDRSPGARRRWCSMGGCGNRAKARRHRERTRTDHRTEGP
jgi:predicted RNA-binding Zn ribbon-like protein